MYTTTKLYKGTYRVSNGGVRFGQLKKVGSEWHAEIRVTDTGNLVRYAGIWETKCDAIEEIEHILDRD